MVDELVQDQAQLIPAAVTMIKNIREPGEHITGGPVTIAPLPDCENKNMDGLVLSSKVMAIIRQAVAEAATASTLTQALEIGYAAFGDTACTAAAKEGISAFLERRPADFIKTG